MVFRALCLAALLAAPAAPQERVLSWEDAAALALSQNPDLTSARLSERAGRHDYRGSYNGLLPQLTLSNTRNENKNQTPASRWEAQASVSMSLLDMGTVAGIRRSKASLASAAASARQTAADLRYDLRSAFLNLLLSQENLQVAKLVAEVRRKGSDLVALRYRSGRESKGNTMRAAAQALQAQAELSQAGRGLRTARRLLARRLGLDDFETLSATGTLTAVPAPDAPAKIEEYLSRRPDLAGQEAQVRSAAATLSDARSAFWPSLSARYSRSSTGPTELPRSQYSWTAAATLSLPLFSGGPTAAYHDIAAASKRLDAARQDLRAARYQALVDLEESWSDFARAAERAAVDSALLAASRQRSEEADIRYASGLLSYDNWEIIASDRVTQENKELQARLSSAVSEAAWERALGKGLGE